MAFWRHFVEKVTCLEGDAISTQSRAWMVRDATSFASIIARGYTIMRTFATHVPDWKCRISGSAPTFPMMVTLFANSGVHVTVLGGAVCSCWSPAYARARVARGPAGVYEFRP